MPARVSAGHLAGTRVPLSTRRSPVRSRSRTDIKAAGRPYPPLKLHHAIAVVALSRGRPSGLERIGETSRLCEK